MAAERPVTVFIADNHSVAREALKRFIENHFNLTVIGEAASGLEVLDMVKSTKPDVVIMDLAMQGLDGIQCIASLRTTNPETKVIALTANEDPASIRGCLAAGGRGYVLKGASPNELVLAITVVSGGGTYLDPIVSARLQQILADEPNRPNRVGNLTEREIQVVMLISRGLSGKEISKQLNIGLKTVDTYKSRAMEKLDLHSRADLIRFAVDHGWLVHD